MCTASMDAAAHTRQPGHYLRPGANALGEPAAGPRQQQGHGGDRHQCRARHHRAVAGDDLQGGDEDKREPAEGAVDDEGDGIGRAELRRSEDRGREHGISRAPFGDGEGGRGNHGQHHGTGELRRGDARGRQDDDRVGDRAQRADAGQRAGPVDAPGQRGVTGFGNMAPRRPRGHRGDRDVDQEDRPPAAGFQQPPAQEGRDRGGHPAEPGPRPDRAGAVGGLEGRLDDRQAGRRHQCASDALHGSCGDEPSGAGRGRAQHRGQGEPAQPGQEHPPPPPAVAERAASRISEARVSV